MPTKTEKTYTETVGRRKTATARIRIIPGGKGSLEINGLALESYFPQEDQRHTLKSALAAIPGGGTFKITVRVRGGGKAAQAEAVRHGIARAAVLLSPSDRTLIKKLGYLKRDPRVKERRKFGLKKARKAAQWSKR